MFLWDSSKPDKCNFKDLKTNSSTKNGPYCFLFGGHINQSEETERACCFWSLPTCCFWSCMLISLAKKTGEPWTSHCLVGCPSLHRKGVRSPGATTNRGGPQGVARGTHRQGDALPCKIIFNLPSLLSSHASSTLPNDPSPRHLSKGTESAMPHPSS